MKAGDIHLLFFLFLHENIFCEALLMDTTTYVFVEK